MPLSRRDALAAFGVAGISSAAACAQLPTERVDATSNAPIPLPPPHDSLLLNYDRAIDLMEEAGVDLLLCGDPTNIYYLTNQQPVSEMLGMHGFVYASLARFGDGRPNLIEGQIGYYFTAPTDDAADLVNRKHYGLPGDVEAFSKLSTGRELADAQGLSIFQPRIHSDHPLSELEARRHKLAFDNTGEIAAGIEGALFRELLDTDLPNKTIAVDEPILRRFAERSGLDLRIVDGERLIRRIRLQKTPAELRMMRYAAAANADSARKAARSVRDGATFQDLRREYAKNAGEHAMNMRYMMIDTLVPNLTPGEIKRGRSFLIDCVSDFEGYHGDYGRTVCVDEPNARMMKIIRALSDVWDRTMPELKAGVRYSDLHALTGILFKDANIDTNLVINPHSVGLRHTDEPSGQEFSYFQKEDLILKENMVLSVDMPLLDTGLGGSAHLEDLVLIGKDGPELLNRSDDRFMVV